MRRGRIRGGIAIAGVLAVALGAMVSVAVASGTKETVTVTGPPFVVDGMGDRAVGEAKIELVNDSPGPHVLIVYKIPNGWTKAQFLEALNSDAPPPEGAFEVGEVFAKPGNRAQKKFNFQTTGTYGFFCPIPSPTGVPHFNLGFVGTFEVDPA
jgi:hypothetical protein